MGQVQVIDARDMVMPEPILAALAAIEKLPAGACLRLITGRDPLLLYPILDDCGCLYRRVPGDESATELVIWLSGDDAARLLASSIAGPS